MLIPSGLGTTTIWAPSCSCPFQKGKVVVNSKAVNTTLGRMSGSFGTFTKKGVGALTLTTGGTFTGDVVLVARGDDAGFQNKVHLFMEAAGFTDVKKVGEK